MLDTHYRPRKDGSLSFGRLSPVYWELNFGPLAAPSYTNEHEYTLRQRWHFYQLSYYSQTLLVVNYLNQPKAIGYSLTEWHINIHLSCVDEPQDTNH